MGRDSGFLVVAAGELLWDLFPSGARVGGAPGNFVWHAVQVGRRHGVRGEIVTAVGQFDEHGAELRKHLSTSGMSLRYVQQVAAATGTVTVELRDHGQPRYTIHEAVAWDEIGWSQDLAGLARAADCLCVGSLAMRSATSRETIQRLLDEVRPDCLRIFDVNLRQSFYTREVIETTLAKVDVLKLNDEEWPVLAQMLGITGVGSPGGPGGEGTGSGSEGGRVEAGLRELLRAFRLDLVVYTQGAAGSILMGGESLGNELVRVGTPAVKVANTVGAGDSYTATVAVGMLLKRPLKEIANAAAAVAAFVCTQESGTPNLPAELGW